MIASRRMICTGKVACMGERGIHAGFWWRNLNDTDHLEDLEVDGRIILKRDCKDIGKEDADWINFA
jgi:hypothetical protein